MTPDAGARSAWDAVPIPSGELRAFGLPTLDPQP